MIYGRPEIVVRCVVGQSGRDRARVGGHHAAFLVDFNAEDSWLKHEPQNERDRVQSGRNRDQEQLRIRVAQSTLHLASKQQAGGIHRQAAQ